MLDYYTTFQYGLERQQELWRQAGPRWPRSPDCGHPRRAAAGRRPIRLLGRLGVALAIRGRPRYRTPAESTPPPG